jgi:UDP-N-acetyl-D-galactosamine dehydrogenase
MKMSPDTKIAVVGLGYVGLPLAVALSKRYAVLGFDISAARVAELRQGIDRTGEISGEELRDSTLRLTENAADMAGNTIFIVTVPTPVDKHNVPDLTAVISASRTVGEQLTTGGIVVFESTVWPGVTEEICAPELEKASSLVCGKDFFLGYSPERINPGDREHTITRITKIVSGQTPEVSQTLAALYGSLNDGNIFIAEDIRTAEAAKVIENAQRDINIAFINEISQIFGKLGISTYDVLEAAGTKWNFLDFKPGLVGGHCIGVDPYYLAHRAVQIGHHPEIILAGRRINDSMGTFVVDAVTENMRGAEKRVLVLGLTFKENVPDLRNTRVIDIVTGLKKRGFDVDVHDPFADPAEAKQFFDVDLIPEFDNAAPYGCIVGAVSHNDYRGFTADTFVNILSPGGLVVDLKNMWRDVALPDGVKRWTL